MLKKILKLTFLITLGLFLCISSYVQAQKAGPGNGPGGGGQTAEPPAFAATLPEQALFIPPILEPTSIDAEGYKVYDLDIQEGSHEFVPGVASATFGYNGNIFGPSLRVDNGDLVRFNITNNLGELTTVHWHGFHVPPEMDGTPHQPILMGETWQPHFEIKNEATLMWYHPHTHGATATQSYSGLAGLFYIEDENSKSLDLPDEYGVNDIPVIVQDKSFDDTGQLVYKGGDGLMIAANGTLNAYVEVGGGLVRFRLLNGSTERFYNFGFSDNREFHQIGTDGGLLNSPVALNRVFLSPGERADIVVDLSDDSDVTLKSYPHEDELWEISAELDILDIKVKATDAEVKQLPTILNELRVFNWEEVDRVRPFVMGGNIIDDPTNLYSDTGPRPFPINGMLMHMARVDAVITLGDVEIWEISNNSNQPHPFHVHDVQFQVVDRNGEVPPANELGLKDTVAVRPGEMVRIVAQFTDYASEQIPYMYHCHIMEHEDAGMMGQFTVVEPDSQYVGSDGYTLALDMSDPAMQMQMEHMGHSEDMDMSDSESMDHSD